MPDGQKKSRDAAFLESRGWRMVRRIKTGMFRRVWWHKIGTDTQMPQYQAVNYEEMARPRKGGTAK